MPIQPKAKDNQDTDQSKSAADENSQLSSSTLCTRGRCKTPFAKEIPNTDAEMKRGRQHANHKKRQIPRIREISRDRRIGGTPVRDPSLRIQMPSDVGECDQPCVALQREQPILHPRILRNVGLSAEPDINSVHTVEQNWQKNERPFDKKAKWNGLKRLRSLVVLPRADQRGAVRPEVLRQKRANGNYAR